MSAKISVRLDFDAIGVHVPVDDIPALIRAALLAAAAVNTNPKGKDALRKAAMGNVSVNTYDDEFGGPVFYIP